VITRLLILWLLSESPQHGYRIKKILDEDSLRFWFPIEVGSIYSALATMLRGGLVEQESVEREGLRPERTRYRITKKGRDRLKELLRRAWREIPRMGDAFQFALSARSELDEKEVNALFLERAKALRQRLIQLDRAAPSAPASEMVERLRVITRAELDWVESKVDLDKLGVVAGGKGRS
jgi:DNA-binding PadR family transcriptional regulator